MLSKEITWCHVTCNTEHSSQLTKFLSARTVGYHRTNESVLHYSGNHLEVTVTSGFYRWVKFLHWRQEKYKLVYTTRARLPLRSAFICTVNFKSSKDSLNKDPNVANTKRMPHFPDAMSSHDRSSHQCSAPSPRYTHTHPYAVDASTLTNAVAS
jgi:hypothetical protein